MAIWVADGRAQINRAAAVLHRVVKKFDPPGASRTLLVRREPNQRLEATMRHLFLNFREIALCDGEIRIDGIHALYGEQLSRVCLHYVSGVHKTRTGAPVNRRMNVAILQIQLCSFEGSLGGRYLRLVHVNGVLLGIEVLL